MSNRKEITKKDIYQEAHGVLTKQVIDRVFVKDYRRAFIYKKTEKLSKAVHLVLMHVGQKNATTDRLATLSSVLIGEVLVFDDTRRPHPASTTMLEIISLIEILKTQEVMTLANAELLAKEYAHTLATLCDCAPVDEHLELNAELSFEAFSKRMEETASEKERDAILSKRTPETSIERRSLNTKRASATPSPSKGSRRERIIGLLQSKGQSSIKDISDVVAGVSEKTIQRELASLIKQGKVKKEGERRWSTYRLVS